MKPLLLIAIILAAAAGASSQTAPQAPPVTTGSITGRVTLAGKPASNVTMILSRSTPDAFKNIASIFEAKPVNKTTTDTDGVYRFEQLAAGRYSVATYAPAYVAPPEPTSAWPPGRVINVAEGQAVEHEDFALTRGAVVTGRITDAQGRPAIGEMVAVSSADKNKSAEAIDPLAGTPFGKTMYITDDRGIYRVYGLPAGSYVVSVGGVANSPMSLGGKARYNQQTFHPGVTDKAQATIVEIKEGGEATGIDIRLGLPSLTYKASGKIVDAATGKPVPSAIANYGSAMGESKLVSPQALGTNPNPRGEFQLEAIKPGKYYAFAWFEEDSEFYSETAPFEITNADSTGLLIKVHRGQTVSGTVTVEGGADAEAQAGLAQLRLEASNTGEGISAPRQMVARIAPDGSFRLTGVQPGRLSFNINPFFTPTKFAVLRAERGGLPNNNGIQIGAGETVSDVRIVLALASGTLRGEIKATGEGALGDYLLEVSAARTGGDHMFSKTTSEVDGSGRFTIEELIPGDYEVTVRALGVDATADKSIPDKQRVTIAKDSEASVTLTINLPAKKGKEN